ncbi:MAG: hypothetical protein K8S94_01865 [Planctomycetia bacterium]|nr:hypothetical protein [Planctomycetia bacterium]
MSDSRFESANVCPGNYTGTLVMSCIARSVRTRNVGVTLYWDISLHCGDQRRVWRTLWLSPKAVARTKVELARLGVRTLADLDNDPPVPLGAACRLVVADVQDRDGYRECRIVHWQVLSVTMAQQGVPTDDRS